MKKEVKEQTIFGKHLQDLLDKKNITQKKLHELTGVSANTISTWCWDVYPAVDDLLKIAKALGCDIKELVDFNSSPKTVSLETHSGDSGLRELVEELRADKKMLSDLLQQEKQEKKELNERLKELTSEPKKNQHIGGAEGLANGESGQTSTTRPEQTNVHGSSGKQYRKTGT